MATIRIPIARPTFGEEEEEAVLRVMRSGMLAQGSQVAEFEEQFAARVGGRHGVAVANGTAAIHLALAAHGISTGDEVITTALTFIASANAICHAGARPVFADVDDSLNMDPRAVERLITPCTRAILVVHLHGNPADMEAFTALSERRGLVLIQDACQAVGATYRNRSLGAFGTACYSLYATKNITTGEGGMVVTNDAHVAEACRLLRNHAYTHTAYEHSMIAYNLRLTEMQAALGLVQLKRLDELTQRRRATAAFYDQAIRNPAFGRPRAVPGHVYHQYVLRAGSGRRSDVLRELERNGIGAGVHYPVTVPRQPAYSDFPVLPCPLAEAAASDMLSIPVHPGVTDADRAYIADVLNGVAT